MYIFKFVLLGVDDSTVTCVINWTENNTKLN